MKLYTISRDKAHYDATADFKDGKVVVNKGSKINRNNAPGFKPKKFVATLRDNDELFEENCYLKEDVTFNSLSSAATFVTGRIANGMIVWKTEDGKYVKYSLARGGEK